MAKFWEKSPLVVDPTNDPQWVGKLWINRWSFWADMNNDNAVTISDAWIWFKFAFYAPGDWLLLMVMSYAPPVFAPLGAVRVFGWKEHYKAGRVVNKKRSRLVPL